ncbi:hypothetical protein AMR76_10755 [Vibrio furnissii]|uniref:Uncharacterized protein n=1 Tax=Vibrio furnissii TaxID=29494 RepID=A0A0Q2R0V4_VIBFU|nr:hypothetical protein [Vibrio furnissii]KQH85757.1 hypothetical protein AMR76_10755 [Vibrio furnissii]
MINKLKLNPNLGLDRQPIFWIAVLFPVLLAVGLGIPLWSEYTLEFSAPAYLRFMELSQLPLTVSALSIPLGVLVGRIHGTKQTSLQIEKTNLQLKNAQKQLQLAYGENKKKNYLEHYSHFKDYVQNIEKQISVDVLYQNLFPSASLSSGSIEVDMEFILSVYSDLVRSLGIYKGLKEDLLAIYDDEVKFLSETQISDFTERAFQINLLCMSALSRVSLAYKWEELGCLKAQQGINKEVISALQFLPVSNASQYSIVHSAISIFQFVDIHHSTGVLEYFRNLSQNIGDEECELVFFDTDRNGKIYGYT